ncbi:LysR family transcriptional regulator [Cystobacter fuscus]|uniref:LysR family transcriptional regulator n=1 Tax=Cystobacter fuscus TaxID=43 RepID=UPI002B2F040F|nr:LysR family transcriptional regulator [Cystobacter fuscus]
MQSMRYTPTELLPALVALLDTASVTSAAKRLGVGQPAMSRTLEKLRAVTGDPLLVRQGRRMVRTRRAEQLLPQAEAILAGARRVLAPEEAFDPATATGIVTLALGDDLQVMLSGALLTRLRKLAPGIDVRVRALTEETPRDAVRGVVDLGVVPDILEDYSVPGVDDLVVKRVYARKFVTASREKRPASLRAFLAAEHVLVSPRGEGGGYVDEMLEKLGQQRRVAVTVPGFIAALELVKQTELISTLPDDVVRVLGGRLHVQKCPVETPTLYMSVFWASRFTQDGRHAWLRGVVTDVVRSLGPR